jgi:hypothetical protein
MPVASVKLDNKDDTFIFHVAVDLVAIFRYNFDVCVKGVTDLNTIVV